MTLGSKWYRDAWATFDLEEWRSSIELETAVV